MAIDNKLTNVIGVKMPFWIVNQLDTRAKRGALSDRSKNSNLQYLTNKTSWVRLVSSVDVSGSQDLSHFQTVDPSISKPSDLAKNYVLFGGTSKFANNSNALRSGFHNINSQVGGSYGMLGEKEIQDYGYRPMPGITRVHVDTQGRLGAVRHATIDIKCWNKAQLDIIDALYFKLGYTMFLEWGHAVYYPNEVPINGIKTNTDSTLSSEMFMIDPFSGWSKEELTRKISQNCRNSFGNYDAMIGIVTNFTFAFNQEGGYDCTVRLMSMGVLGDSLRINNSSKLIDLLTDEVQLLNETLKTINPGFIDPGTESKKKIEEEKVEIDERANYNSLIKKAKEQGVYNIPNGVQFSTEDRNINNAKVDEYNYVTTLGEFGDALYVSSQLNQEFFPLKKDLSSQVKIQLDSTYFGNTYANVENIRIKKNLDAFVPISSDNLRSWSQMQSSTVPPYQNYFINTGTYIVPADFLPRRISPPYYAYNPAGHKNTATGNLNAPEYSRGVEYRSSNNKEIYYFELYSNFSSQINAATQKIGIQAEALELIKKQNSNLVAGENSEPRYSIALSDSSGNFEDTVSLLPKNYTSQDGTNVFDIINNVIKQGQLANVPLEVVDVSTDPGFVPNLEYPDPLSAGATKTTKRIYFTVKFTIEIPNVPVPVVVSNLFDKFALKTSQEEKTVVVYRNLNLDVYFRFNDTNLIKNFDLSGIRGFPMNPGKNQAKKLEEKRALEKAKRELEKSEKQAFVTQISEALAVQSNLELSLRTIQVSALNSAFFQSGADKADLNIGEKVYPFQVWNTREYSKLKNRSLAETIFSTGTYQNIIKDLLESENIKEDNYLRGGEENRFKINAKYGFATTLMGSDSLDEDIFTGLKDKNVNYKQLLTAFVVPYKISSDLVAGIKTNHPVYISLGFLLMLLNHSCMLYEESQSSSVDSSGKSAGNFQKPLVYIDYNTELNLFQTCPQQMSTNPWVTLMKVNCSKSEYAKIFDDKVLTEDKTKIRGQKNQDKQETQQAEMFDPENEDLLSSRLPEIKKDHNYCGKLMNILLNVDYLTQTVRENAAKDGSNGVYLKPFLEKILTDVNKYLGNFNAFRLNYVDKANTYQIVDDHYIYTPIDEVVQGVPRQENRTEIPLVGRYSVAKTLQIKTEMGSKLSSLIAISANSSNQQSQNSINADSTGFINDNYVDRIVPRRVSAGGESSGLNGEIVASQQFNKTIEDFYSTVEPSESDVAQATSFLIEKISKVKNSTTATRATAMIPLGVEFSTDGISGISMYQTFTVSDDILPYTYYAKKRDGFIDSQTTFVGFVIVGLTDVIENNIWTTSIRSNMVGVKDKTAFSGEIVKSKEVGTLKSYANLPSPTTNVPNATTLRAFINKNKSRISEKQGQLSSYGDITATTSLGMQILLEYLIDKYKDLNIEISAGNDVFHAAASKNKDRPSLHIFGRGIDFTISQNYAVKWKPGTKIGDNKDKNYERHIKLNADLQNFVKLRRQYYENIDDEYLKGSINATGPHFHVSFANNA